MVTVGDDLKNSYKKKFTHEQICKQADNILKKYPDRIPIIVQSGKDSTIPKLEKNKFLVPRDITLGQFIYIIRRRVELKPEEAMFVFINDSLVNNSKLMSDIYDEYKDETGFLFCHISNENTFG